MSLIEEIKACTICSQYLVDGVRPVFSFNAKSKIVIIGQAPGRKVHESGIPWDDKSGENLRSWLGVNSEQFYNPDNFAIVPMGFCYPGTGKNGDLPPRPECAPQWHSKILTELKSPQLILLIGSYAQSHYLQGKNKPTLTETVKSYKEYLPNYFVLPHPSPRNNIWKAKNPWFEIELLPELKRNIQLVLN
ncbi:uracil-DNA glycosylase family protein [Fulvivirga lutea]|uniref:Uracil-DNA glycosylase family protein n=1 Tax=Fulvivirga lutea TaxID=2810512 RepID=A0A974WID9_9BACT|nr:uracil-DNA glycosylase family protein [Fulvivirga lutea]QSE99119.1 uracil-DNA glycosylase family protein [Fulvivirga lutea]